jgi:hypothetical protein
VSETSKRAASALRKGLHGDQKTKTRIRDLGLGDLFTLDQIWDVRRHICSYVICGIHECEYAEIEDTP